MVELEGVLVFVTINFGGPVVYLHFQVVSLNSIINTWKGRLFRSLHAFRVS